MGKKAKTIAFNVSIDDILKESSDEYFLDVCTEIIQLIDSYEDNQFELLGSFLNELVRRYEESLDREDYLLKELRKIGQRELEDSKCS